MRYDTVKDNRVLVNTSMWIAYFKDTDPVLAEKIDGLLTSSDVYVPRDVIAELIKEQRQKKRYLS